MYCWYCYWGWPEPVAEIFIRYKQLVGENALWSIAHIVWEDENFDTESIEHCLAEPYDDNNSNYPEQTDQCVKESLEELLAIPEEIRDPEAFLTNGWWENERKGMPEDYPPPAGMMMVKV